jgi:hypothetical protein
MRVHLAIPQFRRHALCNPAESLFPRPIAPLKPRADAPTAVSPTLVG